MGPSETPSVPSRPRFYWDLRNVPWIDGKGNQEGYYDAVNAWRDCHNRLQDSNNNKIPSELQGIMLPAQLYGRAKNLCRTIDKSIIQSSSGVDEILKIIYKRDALAVVSDVYTDFMQLIMIKLGTNESFKNYESRFASQLAKFHSNSDTVALSDALSAFILLANANIENNQRLAIVAP